MEENIEEEIKSFLYSLIENITFTEACNSLPEIGLSDVRKARSISSLDSSDIGDLSSFSDSDTDPLGLIHSADDSEEEFKQYLRKTKSRRQQNYVKEHCWNLDPKRLRSERRENSLEDEYALLPDISQLSIKCSKKPTMKLGVIDNIVGCVAMIKPTGIITQILDLDTILFNKDKEAVGAICDIVGTVKLPVYCFKLDSNTKDSLAVGTELYYVPADEDYTKKLIDVTLPTPWEQLNPSDEEIVFSDDEKEMQHNASKRIDNAVLQLKQQQNNTDRKRNNNNHRVHFQQSNTGQQQQMHNNQRFQQQNNRNPSIPDVPRSQLNKRGKRGGRRGPDYTYQDKPRQMNSFQPSRNTSYPQENQPRREPRSTNDNPYAEFGCYDTFTTDEVRRNIYRRM